MENTSMTVLQQIQKECTVMAKYALSSGMNVPPEITQAIESVSNQQVSLPDHQLKILTNVHKRLTQIIAPATPFTLLLLNEERERAGFWRILGPVGLIRRLMVTSILSLMIFIGLSLFLPEIDPNTGQLLNPSIENHLIIKLFYISAAALGASFSALFKADRYIAKGTFDPTFEASYWIRFVLGLVAGILLAELIPLKGAYDKPILAMLGGFSSTVVRQALQRMVETVKTLIKGDGQEMITAQEIESKVRLAEMEMEHRLKLTADLMRLQQQINPNTTPEDMQKEVNRLLNEFMPLQKTENIEKND